MVRTVGEGRCHLLHRLLTLGERLADTAGGVHKIVRNSGEGTGQRRHIRVDGRQRGRQLVEVRGQLLLVCGHRVVQCALSRLECFAELGVGVLGVGIAVGDIGAHRGQRVEDILLAGDGCIQRVHYSIDSRLSCRVELGANVVGEGVANRRVVIDLLLNLVRNVGNDLELRVGQRVRAGIQVVDAVGHRLISVTGGAQGIGQGR